MGTIMYFNLLTLLVFSLLWIGIVAFLWLKKKKRQIYLVFFTIFYIYLFKVLDYTLFQFQSLLLLKYVMPNLVLNGQTIEKSLNLIPLITLVPDDVKTSLLNILLFVPFGFGLPFITYFRMKQIVFMGSLVSIGIEFFQFLTGFLANMTFRVTDINDVIFNTLGAVIGYILFFGFVHAYRNISKKGDIHKNPFLRYITDRAQINK